MRMGGMQRRELTFNRSFSFRRRVFLFPFCSREFVPPSFSLSLSRPLLLTLTSHPSLFLPSQQSEAVEAEPEAHPLEVDEEEDEVLLEEDLPSVEDEVVPGVDSLPEELLEVELVDEVEVEDSEEDEVDRAIEGLLDEEGELLRTRWGAGEGEKDRGAVLRHLEVLTRFFLIVFRFGS